LFKLRSECHVCKYNNKNQKKETSIKDFFLKRSKQAYLISRVLLFLAALPVKKAKH